MPFAIRAQMDDIALTATAETAKHAFAKAIKWHAVYKMTNIIITDAVRSYSIAEFSSAMALSEIAKTTLEQS